MYDEGMLEETNFPLETYYSMMKKSSKIAVQSEDMDIFKTLQNQPKDYISSEKFPKNKNDKKKKPKSMSEAGLELKELRMHILQITTQKWRRIICGKSVGKIFSGKN